MKKKIGTVVSNKMEKTVVVLVSEDRNHPIYGKRFIQSKKFHAHTEKILEEGVRVEISEIRPMSKTKVWEVTKVF